MYSEFSEQKGVPLDEETLREMKPKERAFWMDFLSKAQKLIQQRKSEREKGPFMATPLLVALYRKAIKRYEGEKYCQVRQLESIFNLKEGGTR